MQIRKLIHQHQLVYTLFTLVYLTSLGIDQELELNINNLNTEYKVLLEKEQIKFEEKKKNFFIAKERLEKLRNFKEKIEKKLENSKKNRKNKFFKDDYDKLLKKYKEYLEKTNREIKVEEKTIAEFLILKKLRGE